MYDEADTEQIMTVEDAHNTADDGETRSENCSEVQGQTRQHSKLINLLEVEQIHSCVKKTRDLERDREDIIDGNTHNPQEILE